MFAIIGITGRVGGDAAGRLLGMSKEIRAVARDEAHAWASKGALSPRHSTSVASPNGGGGIRVAQPE